MTGVWYPNPDLDPEPDPSRKAASPITIPISILPKALPYSLFLTICASFSMLPTPASDRFSIIDRISVTLM